MDKTHHDQPKLPARFDDLVRLMPPRAIADDVALDNAIEMVDRLMALPRLTRDQAAYLETLTQLVEVYEARNHAIDTTCVSGLDSLKSLLDANCMTGADLARLLEVHPSMGSKILNGDRKLTADHLRKLTQRFHVEASVFL